MNKGKEVLQSRKFYAALVALVLVFFGERGGIDPGQLESSVQVLMAYILGTALESRISG